MGRIRAVCVSGQKGTPKKNVGSAILAENHGLEGDAHAGTGLSQVSLLAHDKIQAFREKGAEVADGDFGENLVVEGLDFQNISVGSRLKCGEALLEITRLGKECHSPCQIHKRMGDCIMPREGVFARVLRGGPIRVGDDLMIEGGPAGENKEGAGFRAAVITVSDKCAAGLREDKSGEAAKKILEDNGYALVAYHILPDEEDMLAEALRALCDEGAADLIITTGGTGFSPRDRTPEATLRVIERPANGIVSAMLFHSLKVTPRAMLSRAAAGIRGGTLIINLPGSPKAVEENLSYIADSLGHGLEILKGTAGECAGAEGRRS
jgi:molybdenum cofactor synthesis domain-containing protein